MVLWTIVYTFLLLLDNLYTNNYLSQVCMTDFFFLCKIMLSGNPLIPTQRWWTINIPSTQALTQVCRVIFMDFFFFFFWGDDRHCKFQRKPVWKCQKKSYKYIFLPVFLKLQRRQCGGKTSLPSQCREKLNSNSASIFLYQSQCFEKWLANKCRNHA